jgi:putative transposase
LFTVVLRERRRRLLTEKVEALREAFRFVRTQRPFHIDAPVVLSDQIDRLWTLSSNDADFSARWRLILPRRRAAGAVINLKLNEK